MSHHIQGTLLLFNIKWLVFVEVKLRDLEEFLETLNHNMSIWSLALAFSSEFIRIFSHRGILSQLEEDKLRLHTQLHQQNTDLNNKLEEKGSTFRSQVKKTVNFREVLKKRCEKFNTPPAVNKKEDRLEVDKDKPQGWFKNSF